MLSALMLPAHGLSSSPSAGDTLITPAVQASRPPTVGGDSLSIGALFSATGGEVSNGGAFTSGPGAGTFRIIATLGTHADTSTVTVMATPAAPPAAIAATPVPGMSAGIPFGPVSGWDGSTPQPNTERFTLTAMSVRAEVIVDRINAARSRGLKLVTAMTGGAHANYKTDGAFDITKWQARMDSYNTPAIKAAVAEAVADGTLLGNSVMDEPANATRESTWGPPGTMTKARVDALAVYARSIFPTLPMGVALDYRIWPDQRFRELDFVISQYRSAKGPVTAYRDGALALGARDGHAIIFSLNILDGGKRAANCPVPKTGGPGTYSRNCRMTPEEVLDFGKVLGPAGCGLLMWRYDPAFMANPENQQAFDELTKRLKAEPAKSCSRA